MVSIVADCYLSHNLGDDLFLTTLVSRYPNVHFVVFADSTYEYLHDRFSNLELVISPNRHGIIGKICGHVSKSFRRNKYFRSADAVVTIGGSLYWEATKPKSFKDQISEQRRLHNDRHKARITSKYMVIGANFGPWHSDYFLNLYRNFFAQYCDDVCFRDSYSADLFSTVSTTRQAPDVLFGMKLPQVSKRHQVFFSIVDLYHWKYGSLASKANAYEQMMIHLIKRYIARGYEVVLCSFCQAEGDEQCLERLYCAALEQELGVRLLRYRDNMDEVLKEIAASKVVIGTRFHSVILGLSAGAAVLPVIYSAKTTHVLEDIGFDMNNTIDLKADDWETQIVEALPEAIQFDVSSQQVSAVMQFAALDQLVEQMDDKYDD
mgnify:FL=1